ncbi:uncharacterized protein LOC126742680 [Anthonomus grandis grandis]|uniref:uncharacterized protein LOC126742680 n=1 Tax=Anthonomus grandis grandis TaxID=2921223 RepID=UPI0021667056|nr:uncharacterized protein LOC126742680 [Anthonomus grandis grandis]
MSNVIPPLLSDTPPPPPIDDHEEDDEFGDFAGSNNLSIDCDDSYSPPGTPLEIPTVPFDLDPDPAPPNKTCKSSSVTKDFHDKRKDSDSPPLLNGILEDLKLPEHVNNIDTAETVTDHQEINCDIQTSFNNVQQLEVEEISEEPCVCDKVINELESVKQFDEECNNSSILQESGDIVTCITLDNKPLEKVETKENINDFAVNLDDEFADFSCAPAETDSDDFGDFTSITIVTHQDNFASFPETPPSPTEDDDFGDFASISTLPMAEPPQSRVLLLNEKQALEKSTEIVKEMFPVPQMAVPDFREGNFEETDKVFNQIKNITETHALAYQWSKSASQNLLLKALNIDSRNILFGPGWNPSMPRFAANLSLTPLEPVKSEILTPVPVREPQKLSTAPTNLPGFDLGLSENTESLSTKETLTKMDPQQPLEPTTVQPTKSDLEHSASILQDDFDDFVSYSPPRESPPGHNIILRETHISNKEPDIVSWLEPTIVTPELTRKDRGGQFVEPEEDFDEFQMVVVPEASTSLKVQPLEASEAKPQIEDDFGDFTSYALPKSEPVVLLQPTVIESKPLVSWPDPGITDDEIRRFEALGHLREKSKKDESGKKVEEEEEEDEWSDFVSVNQSPVHKLKTEKERCSTPDLPLSVLNLGSVQPAKQPIPVITPNGLVQTKLSSKIPLNIPNMATSKVYPQIPSHPPKLQPSIISHQYGNYMAANSGKSNGDEDEWSDFVSHQSATGTGFPETTRKVTGNGAAVSPSMPELDFLTPRHLQWTATGHRK